MIEMNRSSMQRRFEMVQAQDSLYEQLKRLIPLANKAGLYDAADHIQREVEQIENNLKKINLFEITILGGKRDI
jgi:gamma-glutamyl:cysteine ligase YbdK (ATP-grasp superfamily)